MTGLVSASSATAPQLPEAVAEPAWRVLTTAKGPLHPQPPTIRNLVIRIVASGMGVLLAVSVVGGLAVRKLAERESVHDAALRTDLLAESVLQPALTDDLTAADASTRAAAIANLDRLVRSRILNDSTVRVKIWSAEGLVVYSDEPQLIGRKFTLGEEEKQIISQPETRADVSDATKPENEFERDRGKILEVYRPVWTPTGQVFIFETYSPYSDVLERSSQLWRGFTGLLISSLLALVLLLVPLVIRLWRQLNQAHARREEFLHEGLDASLAERRRIAGTLHDGVVQEIAGSAFSLAGLAQKLPADHAQEASRIIQALRASVAGMRSLLVQIYPPNLATAGLAAALEDLVSTTRSREIAVDLVLPDGLQLSPDLERLVYRFCQECFRNIIRHAQATEVQLHVTQAASALTLWVDDNGVGFDSAVFDDPQPGHLGLQVMIDLAAEAGAELRVQSAPDHGTTWVLSVAVDSC